MGRPTACEAPDPLAREGRRECRTFCVGPPVVFDDVGMRRHCRVRTNSSERIAATILACLVEVKYSARAGLHDHRAGSGTRLRGLSGDTNGGTTATRRHLRRYRLRQRRATITRCAGCPNRRRHMVSCPSQLQPTIVLRGRLSRDTRWNLAREEFEELCCQLGSSRSRLEPRSSAEVGWRERG